VSRRQANKCRSIYSSSNPFFKKFFEKEKIDELVYTPWVLGVSCFLQTFFYVIFEIIQNIISEKFERELIILPDGGTVGIDWNVDL
jgi:hypothetical protein